MHRYFAPLCSHDAKSPVYYKKMKVIIMRGSLEFPQGCQRGFDEKRLFQAASEVEDYSIEAKQMDGSIELFGEFMEAATLLRRNALDDEATDADSTLRLVATQAQVALRAEFQARFRNISRIMDCVGCEKCRLWGKLQVRSISKK